MESLHVGEALDEIKKQSRALQQETALQLEHEAAMHRRALHEERQAVMASVAADGVDDDISEAYAGMKLEMTAAKSELVHLSEKMLLQLDSTREHAAGWQRGVSDLERQLSEQTEMYEGQVETLSAERRAQEGRAAEEVAALAAELAQRDAQLSAQDEQLRTLQAQLVESQAQHARGTSAAAEQARLCQRLRAEKAAETARAEAAEKRVRQLEVAEQSSERERDETGGKLQALRAEHRQAEREVEELRGETRRVTALESRTQDLEDALHAESEQVVSLKLRLARVEGERDTALAARDRSLTQLEEVTATGKEEERELVLLRREVADVEAWAAHLGAENEFLSAQVSALESEPAPAAQQLPQRALQPNGSAVGALPTRRVTRIKPPPSAAQAQAGVQHLI